MPSVDLFWALVALLVFLALTLAVCYHPAASGLVIPIALLAWLGCAGGESEDVRSWNSALLWAILWSALSAALLIRMLQWSRLGHKAKELIFAYESRHGPLDPLDQETIPPAELRSLSYEDSLRCWKNWLDDRKPMTGPSAFLLRPVEQPPAELLVRPAGDSSESDRAHLLRSAESENPRDSVGSHS